MAKGFIQFCLFVFLPIFASATIIDPNKLPRVDWKFSSTNLNIGSSVYTPFFMTTTGPVLYTGGNGAQPNNGVIRMTPNANSPSGFSEKMVITNGPDLTNYNYFRAPRVAKNGSELWMLVEVSGCYSGCDSAQYPKRLATYQSTDDGLNWKFLGFASVDGATYVSQWFAHTGLIFNPQGASKVDIKNLANNRFITLGENKNIFISADGINYKSIAINHPFPKDRLVFASIAKTPFGFHMTSSANWSDSYYTTTVRHLFSKDLINWYPIESNSFLKNPSFYKGIHLSYDAKTRKLWAISPCGAFEACGYLASVDAKDYLTETPPLISNLVPVGEFVFVNNGKTAMIVDQEVRNGKTVYKIRLADGSYDSGYSKEMFLFPLKDYKRQGCFSDLCVGDTVYVGSEVASIMGIYDANPAALKYALKFVSNGSVDTGYTRDMLRIP